MRRFFRETSKIWIFALLATNLFAHPVQAQFDDGTDAYDPFADYSEFEEATDEEADINFFRNGRFLTVGFFGGYRMFTSVLGELYQGGASYGGFVSYFFDLRFAIQIGYMTGDHPFNLLVGSNQFKGLNSVSSTSFNIKYYLNTQNVTRGLAKINPYLIGGFSQVYRTQRFNGTEGFTRDGATGFEGGIGVEFPIMRNKLFIGTELSYQLVNFSNENTEMIITGSNGTPVSTGIFPRGDLVRFLGILGINF